ncbi:MAG TPA: hypothetical protein VNF04_08595 [Stellaceae bacterium]|nr:hypothetical protein [Stellaceae bacterium]
MSEALTHEAQGLLAVLRQSGDPETVGAISCASISGCFCEIP